MDKKYLLTMAAAAAMFAACSDDAKELNTPELATNPTEVAQQQDIPVAFGAYVNRATTRAGNTGIINGTKLGEMPSDATAAKTAGFGVFGFYTDNNEYDPQSQPNFFYNQQVYAKTEANTYVYEPIKYWPNEYGSTAESDDADKVSFFAYAPYVEVQPSSGKVVKANATDDDDKWGIVGMSRNSAAGDPIIKYIGSFDQDKSVDLMWGVYDEVSWPVVNGTNNSQTIETGKPWLNVMRPLKASATDQLLRFNFKHALAQLTVKVNTFSDGNSAAPVNDKTRIYIRSIKFTGFAMKGALNLNNTEANKALWLDFNGTADLENGEAVTVFDGRKDGKEGATGSEATNEKVLGLNPQFIQDENQIENGAWTTGASSHDGVTETLTSIFRKSNGAGGYVASTAPIMVIPTGDAMEVEIVYDVETIDGNLANYISDAKTNGTSVENRITKKISFGSVDKLENGKHYTLNLHLGMNSVKFDAAVTEWQEGSPELEIDLPSNLPQYAAAATPTPTPVVVHLPAATTQYDFAITGLNGSESVTATGSFGTPSTESANTTGVAFEKVTNITPNPLIMNQGAVNVTWTGASSGKAVTLSFVQLAHPLGLKVGSDNTFNPNNSIQLTTTATIPGSGGYWQKAGTGTGDAQRILVKKNGASLAYKASPGDNEFSLDYNTGKITLGKAAVAGDVFEITVKTGDAPEETIVVKCVAPAAP